MTQRQVKLLQKILEMNLEESSKDEELSDSWERLLQEGDRMTVKVSRTSSPGCCVPIPPSPRPLDR